MFLEYLQSDPAFFISAVVTVVVSITLHELAHGAAAIAQGDDTPIVQKRMTLNPLVHMGGWSIVMMLLAGIAWGQMPINPARMRGRYSAAWVALAGPATNVMLALAGGAALGLWRRWGATDGSAFAAHAAQFLWVFTYINVGLAVFNLLPAPPLDGAAALGSFVPAYRRLLSGVNPLAPLGAVILLIVLAGRAGYGLWDVAGALADGYVGLF